MSEEKINKLKPGSYRAFLKPIIEENPDAFIEFNILEDQTTLITFDINEGKIEVGIQSQPTTLPTSETTPEPTIRTTSETTPEPMTYESPSYCNKIFTLEEIGGSVEINNCREGVLGKTNTNYDFKVIYEGVEMTGTATGWADSLSFNFNHPDIGNINANFSWNGLKYKGTLKLGQDTIETALV